jgi:hypothetical protein
LAGLNHQLNVANAAAAAYSQAEVSIQGLTSGTAALLSANQLVLSTRGDYTRDLQRITTDLPTNAYFTSIDIGDTAIDIQGEADSVFRVVDYATTLETTEPYRDVRIVQLAEVSAGVNSSGDGTPGEASGIIGFTIHINK